jgi:hypothetical protein
MSGDEKVLDAGMAHGAEALDDCALLLTVAMPSTIRDGDPTAGQGGRCDALAARELGPPVPERKGRSAND